MSGVIRVLFVDDEPGLRVTLPAILRREGFEVKVASNVSEALALITAEKFDVLVADLNLGEPGDGFTIVSAMRRVQPRAVNLILTGYPAFQAALRAIHMQVDDFLIKGTDPQKVLKTIRDNLSYPRQPPEILTKRLALIIAGNRQAIIDNWYSAVERDLEITQIPLSRDDRVDHLPDVLDELVQPTAFLGDPGQQAHDAAVKHGQTRRQQKYTLSMLLKETRILQNTIASCTQDNLLHVDLSCLISDMIDVNDRMHQMLTDSLKTFLQVNLPETA